MNLEFTPRSALSSYEWDAQNPAWKRIELDRQVLNELSKRSNLHGIVRVSLFTLTIVGLAVAAVMVGRYNLWLAIPILYAYYFFYGFWVALAHELQHRIVFEKSMTRLSEIIYYIVQTLIWNSPRYARISHQLHHRYTMVQGMDPETNWPQVITSKWLRKLLLTMISNILIVGAFVELYRTVKLHIQRIVGIKDRMMQDHCTESDVTVIRIESLAILLVHLAVATVAVWQGWWWLILFVTLAWQIGWAIEGLWHLTEHVGRAYNVNDPRLCTRSVKVSPFVRLIYGGLDDHVDHHIFPGIPSRNLPKLHKILRDSLPEPKTMVKCWREMFAIARQKDTHPEHEYVPIKL